MTLKFTAAISSNGQLILPAGIAGQIPPGRELRVLVSWETTADRHDSYRALAHKLNEGSAFAGYEEETVFDCLA